MADSAAVTNLANLSNRDSEEPRCSCGYLWWATLNSSSLRFVYIQESLASVVWSVHAAIKALAVNLERSLQCLLTSTDCEYLLLSLLDESPKVTASVVPTKQPASCLCRKAHAQRNHSCRLDVRGLGSSAGQGRKVKVFGRWFQTCWTTLAQTCARETAFYHAQCGTSH